MITVKDNKSLNEAIAFLENQQKSELYLLKEHFDFTKEQLNPLKIIKDGFTDAMDSPDIKGKLLKGVFGLVSGFLAKKFVIGSNAGIISKLAGTALQTGVTGLIMKNGPQNIEAVKDNGILFLQKALNKLKIK